MGSIKNVVSEPIEGHEDYHMMVSSSGLQLPGPGELFLIVFILQFPPSPTFLAALEKGMCLFLSFGNLFYHPLICNIVFFDQENKYKGKFPQQAVWWVGTEPPLALVLGRTRHPSWSGPRLSLWCDKESMGNTGRTFLF